MFQNLYRVHINPHSSSKVQHTFCDLHGIFDYFVIEILVLA